MQQSTLPAGPRATAAQWIVATVALVGLLLVVSSLVPQKRLTEKAYVSKTISNMKQVMLACRLYATDWEGEFPDGSHELPTLGVLGEYQSSNDAWAALYDSGVLQSPLYWTSKARLCSKYEPLLLNAEQVRNDRDLNYFAYTGGLKEGMNELFPVSWEVHDIDRPMAPGTWSKREGHPWRRAFVVGYIDGSAQSINLDPKTHQAIGGQGRAFYQAVSNQAGSEYETFPADKVVLPLR